jgi:SAM-dependent methyltransferase
MVRWKHAEKSEQKFNAFWEMKALKYPGPFDKNTFEKTQNVISMAKEKGVETKEKRILDIGCGTGIYTLPLAMEASCVTGLDSSDTMIRRLIEDAGKHNISNLGIIKGSWNDTDIENRGLKKAFDIVWTSMSMAVKDKEDFMKMEACSRDWCVFIGWGRTNRNHIMEEAFMMHNINYGPHPGVAAACSILQGLGRSPVLEYFNDFWDWEGTLEEAVEDISGFIEMRGVTADPGKLKDLLSKYEQDGMIRHRTDVEEGIIVWQAG